MKPLKANQRTASEEKYLRYAPVRDVLFVLGAGASHPDGVPLQQDILPMIISDEVKEISASVIGKQVRGFIFDNFSIQPGAESFPRLEAIFGFLDYFIQQNESLSSKYTNENIREIKENLIKIIHYIVNLRTDKRSRTYHLFWEAGRTGPNGRPRPVWKYVRGRTSTNAGADGRDAG